MAAIPQDVLNEYLNNYRPNLDIELSNVMYEKRVSFNNTLKSGLKYGDINLFPINNNYIINQDIYKDELTNIFLNTIEGSVKTQNEEYFNTIFSRNTGYNKIPLSLALKIKHWYNKSIGNGSAFDSLNAYIDNEIQKYNFSGPDFDETTINTKYNDVLKGRSYSYHNLTDLSNGYTIRAVNFNQIFLDKYGNNEQYDLYVNELKPFPVIDTTTLTLNNELDKIVHFDGLYKLGRLNKIFIPSYEIFINSINSNLDNVIKKVKANTLTAYDTVLIRLFVDICKLKCDYIQGNISDEDLIKICNIFDSQKSISNESDIVWFICNIMNLDSLLPNNIVYLKLNTTNVKGKESVLDTRSFLKKQWEDDYNNHVYNVEKYHPWVKSDDVGTFALLPSLGGLKNVHKYITKDNKYYKYRIIEVSGKNKVFVVNQDGSIDENNSYASNIKGMNKHNSNILWFANDYNTYDDLNVTFDGIKELTNGSIDISGITKNLSITERTSVIKKIAEYDFEETLDYNLLIQLISSVGYDNIILPNGYRFGNGKEKEILNIDDVLALLAGYSGDNYYFAQATGIGGLINTLLTSMQYDRYTKVIDEYQSQYIIIKNDSVLPMTKSIYEFGTNPSFLLNNVTDIDKYITSIGENNLYRLLLTDENVTNIYFDHNEDINDYNQFIATLGFQFNTFNDNLVSFYHICKNTKVGGGSPRDLLKTIITNNKKFFEVILRKVSSRLSEYTDTNNPSFVLSKQIKDDLNEFKADTYYNLKLIHDNYIAFGSNNKLKSPNGIKNSKVPISTDIDNILNNDLFYSFDLNFDCKDNIPIQTKNKITNLYDYVKVLDTGNNDVGHSIYVDLVHLKDTLKLKVDGSLNTEYVTKNTIYGLLDNIANNNRFIMHSICSYANLNSALSVNDTASDFANKMFGTNTTIEKIDNAPALIFQLANLNSVTDKSKYETPSEPNPLNSFCLDLKVEDGNVKVASEAYPDKFGESLVSSFVVDFANKNQNMFSNMNVSTNEFANTEEAIKSYTNMVSNTNETKSIISSNNLFNIIQNRSYTCTINSIGNVMIQPLSYFYLKNVPIFNGTYWITNVVHDIKPNTILTTFKGVRQPITTISNNKSSVIRYLAKVVDKIAQTNKVEDTSVDGNINTTSGMIFHNRYSDSPYGTWYQRNQNGVFADYDGLDIVYAYLIRETDGEPYYILELSKIYNQAKFACMNLNGGKKSIDNKNVIRYIVDVILPRDESISELVSKYPVDINSVVFNKLNDLATLDNVDGLFVPDKPLVANSGIFLSNGVNPSKTSEIIVNLGTLTDISLDNKICSKIIDSVDISNTNRVKMDVKTNLGFTNYDILSPLGFKVDNSNKVKDVTVKDVVTVKHIGIYGKNKKKLYILADYTKPAPSIIPLFSLKALLTKAILALKKLAFGILNNNPGNIRKNDKTYIGEVVPSNHKRFKTFISAEYGIAASINLFRIYQEQYKLLTISDMINRYAPSFENNTNNYLKLITKISKLDVNITFELTYENVYKLMKAVLIVESSYKLTDEVFAKAWEIYQQYVNKAK